MLRISVAVAVAVIAACSSPPDTCDQNVVGDIAKIAATFEPGPSTTMQVHLMGPITCSGGGGGSMDISGGAGVFGGTFTFDACTMAIDQDTLTVTGALMFDYDEINGVDFGSSSMLTLQGTVDGCSRAIDETCAVSWGNGHDDTTGENYRTGTVCGRQFP